MLRSARLLSLAFLPAAVLIGSVHCGSTDSPGGSPSPGSSGDSQRLLAFDPAGCVPKSCAVLGASCGVVDDGCGALLDCGRCLPPASSADEPGRAMAEPTDDSRASLLAPPDEDTPLDLRADGGTLLGRQLPTPANSDAAASFHVQWLTSGAAQPWSYDRTPIQEARFVPHTQGAVVLDLRGRLFWLDGPKAEPQQLDTEVGGPLSLAAEGRFIAYTRGEPPFLAVVRYDLHARRAETLIDNMDPLWCPALSPDGREVIFVSATGGRTALWRRGATGTTRLVAETPPNDKSTLPEGPTTPLWIGDTLVYEHGGMLRVLGLDGLERPPLAGWRHPRSVANSGALLAREASLGSPLAPLPNGALEARQ